MAPMNSGFWVTASAKRRKLSRQKQGKSLSKSSERSRTCQMAAMCVLEECVQILEANKDCTSVSTTEKAVYPAIDRYEEPMYGRQFTTNRDNILGSRHGLPIWTIAIYAVGPCKAIGVAQSYLGPDLPDFLHPYPDPKALIPKSQCLHPKATRTRPQRN